jgi:hypothetical protein
MIETTNPHRKGGDAANPHQRDGEVPSPASAGSSCCFNCKHWIGKRRKQTAYCLRLNLSGKDAPSGDSKCVLWEKRPNARSTPNADVSDRRDNPKR